jgi:AcrR family transcriptional regulator
LQLSLEGGPGTQRRRVRGRYAAGTSLQDIADATGLTRPALYHYFGSKEELLSRLVSELTEGPADELGEIRRRTGTTATERLLATGVTTHIVRPGLQCRRATAQ